MNVRPLIVCFLVGCSYSATGMAQAKRPAQSPQSSDRKPATDSSVEELFEPVPSPSPTPGTSAAPASEPGYLGAVLDDRQETMGVRVLQVVPGSPADRGNLRAGDLIIEAGNKTIRGMDDLGRVLTRAAAGTRLNFEVERATSPQAEGEKFSLQVTLGVRPAASERPIAQFGRIGPDPEIPLAEQPLQLMLGVRAVQLDHQWRTQLGVPVGRGALVTSVVPKSAADRAGIRPQMVIVAVNNRAIDSPADLTQRLSQADPAQPLEVAFYSGSQLQRAKITLPRFPADGSAAVDSTKTPPNRAEFDDDDSEKQSVPAAAKIEAMENHIRALQKQIDAIERRLKSLERAD